MPHPITLRRNHTDAAVAAITWTSAMRGLLGKGTDVRIAADLGIPPRAAWIERRRLGIAPFRSDRRLNWTPDMDALLGSEPDNLLGEWLGISAASVNHRRRLLGIESYSGMVVAKPIEWTPAMVNDLGRRPLREFALAWGVPVTAARLERERRSIAPLVAPIVLPDEVIEQLGRVRDSELAERYGIPRKHVTGYRTTHSIPSMRDRRWHLRWTAKRLELLGVVNDTVLSKRWKVSAEYLRAERRRRGIPSSKAMPHWTKTMRSQLGKRSDAQVAATLGLTVHQIAGERSRLGIRGHRAPSSAFRWLPEHDRRLGTVPDARIAVELGLTKMQVAARRWRLGVAAWRTTRPGASTGIPRHRPTRRGRYRLLPAKR